MNNAFFPYPTARHPFADMLRQLMAEADDGSSGVPQPFPMDIIETGDSYLVRAALAGAKLDDITVNVTGRELTISAEVKQAPATDGARVVRSEIYIGALKRALILPETVKAESVAAALENGILEIRILKPEETKPARIPIKIG
jgi:Molecular chaperone (small heat shock protein)